MKGADEFQEIALFLCKLHIFLLFGENVRKWSSGQSSTSKSVWKHGAYVLLVYTCYIASEIPLISPPSIKFDKVLQLVSPKALLVF